MTPESLRVKQWREANKDRYNATMKKYMRERRRKLKEAKVAGTGNNTPA